MPENCSDFDVNDKWWQHVLIKFSIESVNEYVLTKKKVFGRKSPWHSWKVMFQRRKPNLRWKDVWSLKCYCCRETMQKVKGRKLIFLKKVWAWSWTILKTLPKISRKIIVVFAKDAFLHYFIPLLLKLKKLFYHCFLLSCL